MASLVKDARRRSPYWVACYTAADGRRLKKSTKTDDQRKAPARLESVTTQDVIAFRGALLSEGKAPDTVNGLVRGLLRVPAG